MLAVAGVLPVLKAIQGGYDAWAWPAVMLGLASVFTVFTAIATRNAVRLRPVARPNPAGFSSNMVAYREMTQQLEAVGNLSGVPHIKVRSSQYVPVFVDSDFLRINREAGNPKELVDVPSPSWSTFR